MPAYSRFPGIEAVLTKATKALAEIEAQYNKSLHSREVPGLLLVEIKDYLGNLRSALDYLNGEIDQSDRYFPICDHPNDFVARYGKIALPVRAALEKWQPYSNQAWFRWFSVLNNKNKHVTLTPQKRSERTETTVTHPSGSSVKWGSGVTFGGGVFVMGVPIDPRTQLPVLNPVVKTERITWVDFYFDNTGELSILPENLSALPFLKDCLGKVCAIVKDIEAVLP